MTKPPEFSVGDVAADPLLFVHMSNNERKEWLDLHLPQLTTVEIFQFH